MTKEEIIAHVLAKKDLETLCGKIDTNGDLYQEFMLFLLEQPEEELKAREQYIDYYCVRIIMKSSFYREAYEKYYKHHHSFSGLIRSQEYIVNHETGEYSYQDSSPEELEAKEEQENTLCNIEEILKNENWFDRELFLAATTGITDHHTGEIKTYRSVLQMSKDVGIPYKTIKNSLNATTKRIKNKI